MGRTKGSKNGTTKKDIEQFKHPVVKTKELEKNEPVVKDRPLRVDGVSPRKETPPIPQVLVDGGMLYRFLLELRRGYDEFVPTDDKQTKRGAVRVIDEIMDYIVRMEKKT